MYSKDTVHNTSEYMQKYTRIYVIRNYHILIRNYLDPCKRHAVPPLPHDAAVVDWDF